MENLHDSVSARESQQPIIRNIAFNKSRLMRAAMRATPCVVCSLATVRTKMERIRSATIPANGSEEINQLRTLVEKLQSKRATSKSEVAKQRNGDQFSVVGKRFNPLS